MNKIQVKTCFCFLFLDTLHAEALMGKSAEVIKSILKNLLETIRNPGRVWLVLRSGELEMLELYKLLDYTKS